MFEAVVVGGGVIGLTCALRLQQAGARVGVVAADAPEETTSSVAAAVWYPTRTRARADVLEWARRTFDELARQAADRVPGVVMLPTRTLLRSPVAAPPWWATAVPDLAELRPADTAAPFAGCWTFTAPAVEMRLYLPWLHAQLADAGATVVRRRLGALAEAAELAPLVVNATGLAARELCGDPAVRPVRGQLVLVSNPGLRVSVRDEDNPEGYTYAHPRSHDVVLGGTFDDGRWDTTPCPDTGRAIVRRCVAMLPELRAAHVLAHRVGLRPMRSGGVRLETDQSALAGRARLIHNYGHGGAGITLAWGCADAVAALATAGLAAEAPARMAGANPERRRTA